MNIIITSYVKLPDMQSIFKNEFYFDIFLKSLKDCNYDGKFIVITNLKQDEIDENIIELFPPETIFFDYPFEIKNMDTYWDYKFPSLVEAIRSINISNTDTIFYCDSRDVFFQDLDFLNSFPSDETWVAVEDEKIKNSEWLQECSTYFFTKEECEKIKKIDKYMFNTGIFLTNIVHLNELSDNMYKLKPTRSSDQPLMNKLYYVNNLFQWLNILEPHNNFFNSINSHNNNWVKEDGKIYNIINGEKKYTSVIHQWDRRTNLKEIINGVYNEKNI